MRRHRSGVTAAVAALVAAVIGLTAVAAVQARAHSELERAKGETDKALARALAAEKAKGEALVQSEESRKQAEAVVAFLVEAFRSPDPSQEGRQVKVADVLDRASARLDRGFAGSPTTRGALLDALGRRYDGLGLYEQAAGLLTKARAVREAALGPDHPSTLANRNNLAIAYAVVGRTAEAIAPLQEMLRLREAKLGPDHPRTLASRSNLAAAYESIGRWAEAEGLYREVLTRRRKAEEPDSPHLADDLVNLGQVLLEPARWSEAEPLLREAVAIREKAIPDDWWRYDAMSMLGGSLLGQGRYAEAEAAVVAGYEEMKAREARIAVPYRPRLRAAAERVVHLYEGWGRPEKAAAWKAELGMPDLPADVFARP